MGVANPASVCTAGSQLCAWWGGVCHLERVSRAKPASTRPTLTLTRCIPCIPLTAKCATLTPPRIGVIALHLHRPPPLGCVARPF